MATTTETSPIPQPPPPVMLLQMITGLWLSQAISVAATLGVADHLKDGAQSIEELAQKTETATQPLYRTLRALSSVGIFVETEARHFALTPMADLLRSDVPGSLRAFARMMGDKWHVNSWREMLYSVQTGIPSIKHVYQLTNVWDYFLQDPEASAVFNDAMTGFSSQNHTAAAKAYDFSGFTKIVDIGGGHGTLIASILKSNPNLQGVLFDQPQVVAGAPELLAQHGVADRCETVGGDFFQSVPAGDAYISSVVIHDWADAEAIAILKNIRAAIAPHGKLLLFENVIPAGNDPHPGKFLDLEMLVCAGGQERTEAEFRALYAAAGFHLTRIVPTESPICVIEGVPA